MSPIDSVRSGSVQSSIDQIQQAKPNFDADKIKALLGPKVEKNIAAIDSKINWLIGNLGKILSADLTKVQPEDPSHVINSYHSVLDSLSHAYNTAFSDEKNMTPEQTKLREEILNHYNKVIFDIRNVALNLRDLQQSINSQNKIIKQNLR